MTFTDDLSLQVQTLRPRPGDVLVVRVGRALSSSGMACLSTRVHETFADYIAQGVKVVILEEGMGLSLLSAEDLPQKDPQP